MIVVPTLIIATPGEAAEGSRGAYCFWGSNSSAETFVPNKGGVFLGTGSSKANGFRRGVNTLPLAVVVLVLESTFASFCLNAAGFLLLIVL